MDNPKIDGEYLCRLKDGFICIAHFAKGKWTETFDGNFIEVVKYIPIPRSIKSGLSEGKSTIKKIPIQVCKEISKKYRQDQVILVTWDKTENRTHVVTYGKTIKDCEEAAIGGNKVKKTLGWPDEMCHAVPDRTTKK